MYASSVPSRAEYIWVSYQPSRRTWGQPGSVVGGRLRQRGEQPGLVHIFSAMALLDQTHRRCSDNRL